jgi:hypothetical protein
MKNLNVKKTLTAFESKLLTPSQQLRVKGGDDGGGAVSPPPTPPPPPPVIGVDDIYNG